MDKVAYYKDYIYKEAGIMGGLLGGAALGSLVGHIGGTGAAAIRYREPEAVKNMHSRKKELEEYINNNKWEACKYEPNAMLDTLPAVHNLSASEIDNMTVGELKHFLSKKYNEGYTKNKKVDEHIHKTASFKHIPFKKKTLISAALMGVPATIVAAKDAYLDTKRKRTDIDYNKKVLDNISEQKNNIQKYLKGDRSVPLNNFAESYKLDSGTDFSPFVAQYAHPKLKGRIEDYFCDIYDTSQTAADADKELKAKGIDIDNMKYKDYAQLVKQHIAYKRRNS